MPLYKYVTDRNIGHKFYFLIPCVQLLGRSSRMSKSGVTESTSLRDLFRYFMTINASTRLLWRQYAEERLIDIEALKVDKVFIINQADDKGFYFIFLSRMFLRHPLAVS